MSFDGLFAFIAECAEEPLMDPVLCFCAALGIVSFWISMKAGGTPFPLQTGCWLSRLGGKSVFIILYM